MNFESSGPVNGGQTIPYSLYEHQKLNRYAMLLVLKFDLTEAEAICPLNRR
jgi:hypothetical protein